MHGVEVAAGPVEVLTGCRAEQDGCRADHRVAGRYVSRPVDLDRFITVAESIESFRFTIDRLP